MSVSWYEVLKRDNLNREPLVADVCDLRGWSEEAFLEGRLITNWPDDVSFRSSSAQNDGHPDDALANDALIPIFSPRARRSLEDAAIGGIQYLPVKVFLSNGTLLPGFAIANVVNLVDALDFGRSKVDYFPHDWPVEADRGKLWAVKKAALIPSMIANFDVIRLKPAPFSMFVSERLKRIFEANRFTGIGFSKVIT